MLSWLQRHGSSVQVLNAALQSGRLYAVLGALVCGPASLSVVRWEGPDDDSLRAVGMLTTIQTLILKVPSLKSPTSSGVSLDPLQHLPRLQQLWLSDGGFSCTVPLQHLTELHMEEESECGCKLALPWNS